MLWRHAHHFDRDATPLRHQSLVVLVLVRHCQAHNHKVQVQARLAEPGSLHMHVQVFLCVEEWLGGGVPHGVGQQQGYQPRLIQTQAHRCAAFGRVVLLGGPACVCVATHTVASRGLSQDRTTGPHYRHPPSACHSKPSHPAQPVTRRRPRPARPKGSGVGSGSDATRRPDEAALGGRGRAAAPRVQVQRHVDPLYV